MEERNDGREKLLCTSKVSFMGRVNLGNLMIEDYADYQDRELVRTYNSRVIAEGSRPGGRSYRSDEQCK